jgi:hypothetical protein
MKLNFTKQAHDQLDLESQQQLTPLSCECIEDGKPKETCELCDGGGTYYELELSAETSAAIQENLRRQGVPLGKIGTH